MPSGHRTKLQNTDGAAIFRCNSHLPTGCILRLLKWPYPQKHFTQRHRASSLMFLQACVPHTKSWKVEEKQCSLWQVAEHWHLGSTRRHNDWHNPCNFYSPEPHKSGSQKSTTHHRYLWGSGVNRAYIRETDPSGDGKEPLTRECFQGKSGSGTKMIKTEQLSFENRGDICMKTAQLKCVLHGFNRNLTWRLIYS